MNIVMFCHSLDSDWNHGNAHFLRGIVTELQALGHSVRVLEPQDSWSRQNLIAEHGTDPLDNFKQAYPQLSSTTYDPQTFDLHRELDSADVVLVHEWNDHDLVRKIGLHRARNEHYVLLFHDTHHRSVTQRESMAAYDLTHYDGVLAFGRKIRDVYLTEGWTRRAWTWHEAADVRVFYPRQAEERSGDLVWIGNWGDDERTAELQEYLLDPCKDLGLQAEVYGVRYPDIAKKRLEAAGIAYRGWIANFLAPQTFARFRVTVHVPRRPYVQSLPGIPTIRPFEALACGIPLISSYWNDNEHLFTPGKDFLVAHSGDEMQQHLRRVLADSDFAQSIASHGRETILARHTCAHRIDELMAILTDLGQNVRATANEPAAL